MLIEIKCYSTDEFLKFNMEKLEITEVNLCDIISYNCELLFTFNGIEFVCSLSFSLQH